MVRALQIKDFPNYYITDSGDVYSRNYNQTGRIKKLVISKDGCGYCMVNLCKNGKRYMNKVHRLVAKAFIPNPENKPQVNHIDGDKTNNCVSNLEWVTLSENQKHSYTVLGHKGPLAGKNGILHHNSRAVLQIKDNKVINIFYSMKEAERKTGIKHQVILGVCKGNYLTAGGFCWKYATPHRNFAVIQQIKNNIVIQEFNGTQEAQNKTGVCKTNIIECCKGRRKTAGGYQWKYKTKENENEAKSSGLVTEGD